MTEKEREYTENTKITKNIKNSNMRTKVILFGTLAIATVSLVSCGNDENAMPDTGGSKAEFSASINGTAKTRAFDRTWENGDQIGISGTTGGKAYTNVAYQTGGDGNFTATTPGTEIYYQSADPVTFTAYYPWNDLQGASAVTADTWEQAEQKTFDFLWAQANGSKANPNVAFTFAHKMAKVVLTVKCGADVSYDEVKAAVLSLDGFKHGGSFDTATGTAEATGSESAMWEFANNADNEAYNAPLENDDEKQTVSYTLIFFPQTFEAALSFTAELTGKQSFTADLDFTGANAGIDEDAKNEWVAGRQYNMGVVLNKTGITVEGCTIAPWEEVSGGDFPAE